MLGIIVTASVLYPVMDETTITAILDRRVLFTLAITAVLLVVRRRIEGLGPKPSSG